MKRRILRDLRAGIYFRYPPCCVLRFIWDLDILGLPPATLRESLDPECNYVPCGIFHKALPYSGAQFAFWCEEFGKELVICDTEEEMFEFKVTRVIHRPKWARRESL